MHCRFNGANNTELALSVGGMMSVTEQLTFDEL